MCDGCAPCTAFPRHRITVTLWHTYTHGQQPSNSMHHILTKQNRIQIGHHSNRMRRTVLECACLPMSTITTLIFYAFFDETDFFTYTALYNQNIELKNNVANNGLSVLQLRVADRQNSHCGFGRAIFNADRNWIACE